MSACGTLSFPFRPPSAIPPARWSRSLCLITGTLDESITGSMRYLVIGAVALVCIGAVGLGIVESTEDDELRRKRQEGSNYKYAKSWLALCLPLAYCLLDAAGTFADSLVLRTLDEDSANCAYELTFLAAAVICFIYVVVIKKGQARLQGRSAQVCRCAVRDGGAVRVYLRAGRRGARCALGSYHLGLLRRVRPLEPHFPEGKALLEALRHDRAGRDRHRHDRHIRYLTGTQTAPGEARRGQFSSGYRLCGVRGVCRGSSSCPASFGSAKGRRRPAGSRCGCCRVRARACRSGR